MSKVLAFIVTSAFYLLMLPAFGQQSEPTVNEKIPVVAKTSVLEQAPVLEQIAVLEQKDVVEQDIAAKPAPQVGKHVMANMNASSMILSLLMVLGLIIICALVLKRFNLTQQNSGQLKVIASLSLGAKERIVVVQIGEEQLVLGVSAQQISLLKNLETPIESKTGKPLALSTNVLSFLQKNTPNNK